MFTLARCFCKSEGFVQKFVWQQQRCHMRESAHPCWFVIEPITMKSHQAGFKSPNLNQELLLREYKWRWLSKYIFSLLPTCFVGFSREPQQRTEARQRPRGSSPQPECRRHARESYGECLSPSLSLSTSGYKAWDVAHSARGMRQNEGGLKVKKQAGPMCSAWPLTEGRNSLHTYVKKWRWAVRTDLSISGRQAANCNIRDVNESECLSMICIGNGPSWEKIDIVSEPLRLLVNCSSKSTFKIW